jgi:hypothetical protein
MESEGQIRTRIINRAVKMFATKEARDQFAEAIRREAVLRSLTVAPRRASAPAEDGLFTTANYAQSLKEEFGLAIDTDTCVAHLSAMDGIERIGRRTCVWRSVAHARCGPATGGRS